MIASATTVGHSGRLQGKNCLILGGTTGIGLAASRRFVEEGARVFAAGKTADETIEARRIVHGGDRFETVVFELKGDAGDEAGIESIFASACRFFRTRLDILVHVVGISGRKQGDGRLEDCSVSGWDLVLDVNARGVFLADRAAVRIMNAQEPDKQGLRGTIVNLGSVLDRSPSPEYFGTIAYSASKGAVRALTKTAAATYASRGIRVNLLEPGLVETPLARRALQDADIRAYLETKQPLARGPCAAEDIAEAALFLCEPKSRFISGVELAVDAGWSIAEARKTD